MPEPLAKFRVYPGKFNCMAKVKNLYWQVYVFNTWKEMRAAFYDLCPTDRDDDFDALVHTCDTLRKRKIKGSRWNLMPSLGFALFHKKSLNSDVVSHESVHMAIGFTHREKPFILNSSKDDRCDNEERIAYATGSSARQLVNSFYKFKLYDK